MDDYYSWPRYVSVAQRRQKAQRKIKGLAKKGHVCQPVIIEGRAIASTFWGKSWCQGLEAHSDYANRLERGRTYVRSGAVIDLRIAAGKIHALVFGSTIYQVDITVRALDRALWQDILRDCGGQLSSLVALLQGQFPDAVMEVVTRRDKGLFPNPRQIDFRCSCPDAATMCKHIAATLYGVGTRLDTQPDLLFLLREVDPQELLGVATSLATTIAAPVAGEHQRLDNADLSGLFGIELDDAPAVAAPLIVGSTKKTAAGKGTQGRNTRLLKASPAEKVKVVPDTTTIPAARMPTSRKREKVLTASELGVRGIPRHMIQSWLKSGILLRTEQRGVYRTTMQTQAKIKDYLNRF
jgi:uncharacterized Zn finger protein